MQLIAKVIKVRYTIYESSNKGGILHGKQALVQFRADEATKLRAASICENLGIDLQTYLRMCMARLIQENGIPFPMKLEESTANRGLEAMKRASLIAEQNGIADMTLEEINAEISAARG